MAEKRGTHFGLIAALLAFLFSSVASGAIEIFPIVRAAGHQQQPAIDNGLVAWQDNRHGDWDIAIADISSPGSIDPFVLADNFSEAQYPAVSGDIVVWQTKYFMYEDWDIVGMDTRTETFFDVVASPGDEYRPAISGTLVIAQTRQGQYADWDIMGVDISRRDDPQAFWIDTSSEDQHRPDVDGRIVIYEDVYDGFPRISGWDFSDFDDPQWFPVYGTGGPQQWPALAGQWVVWQDEYEGASITGGDDIFHPGLARLFAAEDSQEASYPDVFNNVIVWQDRRNGNWDIYGHNLTTKTTFPIIAHGADQMYPAISFCPALQAYIVVWQDNRNGNWDIYGALLRGAEVAGCASPLPGDVNADGIVDEEDLDEVDADLGQQNGIPIEDD